jgi:photosynthetic reaction center cytochrome c subunit
MTRLTESVGTTTQSSARQEGTTMAMASSSLRWCLVAVLVAVCAAGCERPPAEATQRGYRGTGMAQIQNPRTVDSQKALNVAPEALPPVRSRPGGPVAGGTYQNVKVLGDLGIGEFGRTMNAMSAWVSPEQSCLYCHLEGDFASDAKYTKVVARRMLQMVKSINQDWQSHVGATGVTCYTCHRGRPLPAYRWFLPAKGPAVGGMMGSRQFNGAPSAANAGSSLPSPVLADFLLSEASALPVRVAGVAALPAGNHSRVMDAEATYSFMMHIANALGVNCTYCHNSRSFANWAESSPQRATAWYGIRMVRDLNANYLVPLTTIFPAIPEGRLGPAGDAAKLNCATCHQGVYKPLFGAQMAAQYPALQPTAVPGLAGAEAAAAAASAPAQPASGASTG